MILPPQRRMPAKTMGLTGAILAAWIAYEGFSSQPIIPVKGDVPTIGHGSTYYEDGRKVRMTDPAISRSRASTLAANLLENNYVKCVHRRLGDAPVSETEFRLAVDFAGQYGCARYSDSSIARETSLGRYYEACLAYRKYKFVSGFDCSTPGNTRCPGVWTRTLKRVDECLAQL